MTGMESQDSLFRPDRSRAADSGDAETRGEAPRAPLADRVRPRSFEEFLGQDEIVGPGTVLRRAIEEDKLASMVFWGPPGTGKTTLARLIARETKRHFVQFSAVTSGVADVRRTIAAARDRQRFEGQGTVLFVDEIHRFNRAQQDAFLPHVEEGLITLIGATTENPSFEVNSALLSRCRVFVLKPLEAGHVRAILERALADEIHGLADIAPRVDEKALEFVAGLANGDARVALNAIELAVSAAKPDKKGVRRVTLADAKGAMQKRTLLYDKDREEHYNIISALHKSLRGSDVQAALYWLGRMLEGGEEALYIARRLVRFASEDVGMADPQALVVAVAAKEACDFVGMPECDNALAQCVVYLATAPKSNAIYRAYQRVKRDIGEHEALPVPLHIRNAPTKLMGELGYGKGYAYDHDAPEHYSGQEFLPEALQGRRYYEPGELGFEREVAKRMAYYARLKRERRAGGARKKSEDGESPKKSNG